MLDVPVDDRARVIGSVLVNKNCSTEKSRHAWGQA